MRTSKYAGSEQDDSARAWLERRRGEFVRQRTAWAVRESRWSLARLAVFLSSVALCVTVTGNPLLVGGVILLGIVLFVFSVRKHQAALAQRETADRLLLVTSEALQRCDGQVVCVRGWKRPAGDDQDDALPALLERGPVWSLTDQERDDLDLFAPPVGIFGLLNRTSSAIGARRLRDMLENPLLAAERIRARQASVRWLAENGRERLRLMAALAAARGEDERLSRLIRALGGTQAPQWTLPAWLLRTWGVLSAAFVVFVFVQTMAGRFQWDWWLLVLLTINGGVAYRVRRATKTYLDSWKDVAWAVRAYSRAARQAAQDLPPENELGRLRECFSAVERPDVLSRLYRRVGWAEQGGMAYELVNLVLFVDAHVAHGLVQCVAPHRDALLAGLSALAELDALCSLGSFAAEQPVACYPRPGAETGIAIVGGCHPLVAPRRVVPNDVHLSPAVRMWIITGSNMAGKSTFLRMVGTNVLLAQIGCAATAREMRWSPLRPITDLRARDSLAEDGSYFLAEVRHLRRMVLPPAGNTPILGLIDEPFRGTNAQDQSAASVAVVGRLLESGNLFLLATHDRHLTALAAGRRPARNYHFREDLGGDALVFDYRLHEGPARTRNALRILEREGYPPDLVERAYAWLEDTSPPEAGQQSVEDP